MKSRSTPILVLLTCMAWGQVEDAWSELASNRTESARALFEHAMAVEEDPTLARIGWFLTYAGVGPNQTLADAANRVLAADPNDEACEFVMAWMKPLRPYLPQWVEGSRDIIVNSEPSNPDLRIHYANHLRHIASFSGDRDLFERALDMSKYVTAWRFSQRFGEYPIPDFNREWPASKPEYWVDRPLETFRSGVAVPPGGSNGSGVIFAFSEFQLPSDQEVLFRIFSYQNIEIYLDGARLFEKRNLELESGRIDAVTSAVDKGRHELLVKLTQTRGDNGQFSLNIAARGVAFPEPGEPSRMIDGSTRAARSTGYGLEAKLENDGSDFAHLIRGYLAAGRRDYQAALDHLELVHEHLPESQIVGGLLAEIYLGSIRFLPDETRIGRAYQILSQLVASPDRSTDNAVRLARLLYRANYADQALPLLDDVLRQNPAHCEAIETKLDLSIKENMVDVRESALASLKALGPEHRWALRLRLATANAEGNLVEKKALLERLSRLLPWEGFGAELLEMQEDYAAAIHNYKKRWELFPNNDDYPYAIATNFAKLGDREEQRRWLGTTLEINPSNRRALLDLVNLDCYQGNQDHARERIQAYLNHEPADGDFRQMMSHLDGRTAFESFRVDSHDVIEAAKNKPLSKNADSELLLDQLMVRLFPDGSQMRYTHLVTRVLTKDGVDTESEINLPDDLEILELRTIKQDGTVLYPEDIAHKSTISLSGVGVGDFIDEEHIEYLPPAYYDGDGLDASMSFVFQGIDRIYHHSELVLIYPSDLEIKPDIESKNFPFPVESSEHDGLTSVRWLTTDMPPVSPEPAMPNPAYFLPRASLSYNTQWHEVRDFFTNAIRLRMVLADSLKDQLDDWRDLANDKRALAETLYRNVVDAIEPAPQFYENINLTWENKSGNATLLLARLYEEAGIPCEIILTRPRELLQTSFDIPLPDLFTYALLKLQIGKQTIWVDANRKHLAFGYVPFEYRGSNGLVLDATRMPPLVKIPQFDNTSERVSFHYDMQIGADREVKASGKETFLGALASDLKDRFDAMNRPEIKQRVEVGVNTNFPGAEVVWANVSDETPVGTFALESEFTHDDLVKQDGQLWVVENLLPSNSIHKKYASLPDRDLPVHIRSPHYNQGSVELRLPEGHAWVTKPERIERTSDFGRFVLEIEVKDPRTILVTRVYEIESQMIAVSQYQSFLEFCQFMTENEDVRVQARATQ